MGAAQANFKTCYIPAKPEFPVYYFKDDYFKYETESSDSVAISVDCPQIGFPMVFWKFH